MRDGFAFRGLSYVRVRASKPPSVTPTAGADPLLGFHLPGVFPLPATATPDVQPPLSHLDFADTEAATSSVPQSLNEQEGWLVSLEAADPSEISVLVFSATTKDRKSVV